MPEDNKARTTRLTSAAVEYLQAVRAAVKQHDDGMVAHVDHGSGDGEKPEVKMFPADDAPDSAVIVHACALALRWLDPKIREAALKAEAARQTYIEELQNAWKGSHT